MKALRGAGTVGIMSEKTQRKSAMFWKVGIHKPSEVDRKLLEAVGCEFHPEYTNLGPGYVMMFLPGDVNSAVRARYSSTLVYKCPACGRWGLGLSIGSVCSCGYKVLSLEEWAEKIAAEKASHA